MAFHGLSRPFTASKDFPGAPPTQGDAHALTLTLTLTQVPNPRNAALYAQYKALADAEARKGVHFVGRLANYKYFNMDQAILNALEMFDNLKETGKLAPKRSPADFGPGDGPK